MPIADPLTVPDTFRANSRFEQEVQFTKRRFDEGIYLQFRRSVPIPVLLEISMDFINRQFRSGRNGGRGCLVLDVHRT